MLDPASLGNAESAFPREAKIGDFQNLEFDFFFFVTFFEITDAEFVKR